MASKNARAGSVRETFKCSCGGTLENISIFKNGKLKHVIKCDKCGTTKKRVKDFF